MNKKQDILILKNQLLQSNERSNWLEKDLIDVRRH